MSSALRSVIVLVETISKANLLRIICICFWADRGPYPVILTRMRFGCGAVMVTGIDVVPLLLTGLLLLAYITPRTLFDWVGKLTEIKLVVLLIFPDSVQLIVTVDGKGAV